MIDTPTTASATMVLRRFARRWDTVKATWEATIAP
jgi:hypothetical protein